MTCVALKIANGDRFGPLMVIKEDGKLRGFLAYLCRCDCGNIVRRTSVDVSKQNRENCGSGSCKLRKPNGKKHGCAGPNGERATGAYKSWSNMRKRCYDKNAVNYHRYGGANVNICARWDKFENFLADMGERPTGKSIDRYPDPYGDYESNNCRWATSSQQARNRRAKMVALRFTTQGVAPNTAPQAIPSGTYNVTITGTEEKPTTSGNGSYVQFEFTIASPDPTLNGKKVYDRLNTNNPSKQAMEIAFGTLSAICHVCNRHDIQDTQQLHGIPLQVVVSKQPRGDTPKGTPPDAIQYTNEIKGYKDQYGNDPGQSGGGASGGNQGGNQQGGGAPSWAGGNQGGGNQGNNNGANNNGGGQQNWQGGNQNNQGQGNGGQQNNNGGQQGGGNQNWQGNQGNGGQNNQGNGQQANQGAQNNGGAGNQGGPNPNEPPPWARGGNQGNQGQGG